MADQPDIQLGDKFLEWLSNTPEKMVRFIGIAKEFLDMQDTVNIPGPTPTPRPEGPVHLRPGERPQITTVPLTTEQLDALMNGEADAQVKEDAINFLKGFILAVSLAA